MANLSKRHSRRPGRMDGGSSWISYSDMMAALLLVFVLILCYSLYQYYLMLDTKTAELSQQQVTLDTQQVQLENQTKTLEQREAELKAAQMNLVESQRQLQESQGKLAEQEATLSAAQSLLSAQERELLASSTQMASQQEILDSQQIKIDELLGIRTRIIQDLGVALSGAKLNAKVDPATGNIMMDSAVFFDTGTSNIKDAGKSMLNEFIPIYLSVLLRPEYQDFLGSIIIEGHTDTVGSFLTNLELSQRRAFAVVSYCLSMPALTESQRATLQAIITATGRSYSAPITDSSGNVLLDESRRVEFKFSLKDAEMIEEMNRILSN